MSGFLRNLASRNMEANPAIRPRLASRFEPQTPVSDWPDFTSAEEASIQPFVDKQEGSWLEKTPDKTAMDSAGSLPQKPEPHLSAAPTQSATRGRKNSNVSIPIDNIPPPVPVIKNRNKRSDQTTAEFSQNIEEQNISTVSRKSLSPVSPSVQNSKQSVSLAEALVRNNRIQKQQPQSITQPELRSTIRPNIPESVLPAKATSEYIQHPTQQTAAPTIKVTIGRVEVRAIMPAQSPQPPRTRSAEPKLTLADYLKQRNGA